MNKKIMFSLAITVALLNAGLSAMVIDSISGPACSQNYEDRDRLKQKIEEARKAHKEAKIVQEKVQSRSETMRKTVKVCTGSTIGLLATGGIIAPLVRIAPDMYDFIVKDGVFKAECQNAIGMGTVILATSGILIILTKELSRAIVDYADKMCENANDAAWEAGNNYRRLVEKYKRLYCQDDSIDIVIDDAGEWTCLTPSVIS